MSYGFGTIRRQRKPNMEKGLRVYHGPCESCGTEIHTAGDPPRRTCVECVRKQFEGDQGEGQAHA